MILCVWGLSDGSSRAHLRGGTIDPFDVNGPVPRQLLRSAPPPSPLAAAGDSLAFARRPVLPLTSRRPELGVVLFVPACGRCLVVLVAARGSASSLALTISKAASILVAR